MFVLGSFLNQNEELHVEYKEFCFKINIYKYYSKVELYSLINSGKFLSNFNDVILSNFKKYFDIYVPRYSCSFHNTESKKNKMIYIGVNDFNEITGIPFDGNLIKYKDSFEKYSNELLTTHMSSKCCLNIKIHIEKCEIDEDILSDDHISEQIKEYTEQKKEYERKYKLFVENKAKWIREMYFYKGKLQSVVNHEHVRLDFIEFLKSNNVYEKFPEINSGDLVIESDEVKYHRNNKDKLIYWVIIYKDSKVKQLIKRKPKEPNVPRTSNFDYCVVTKLTHLRKRFHTQNISFFIMKIMVEQKSQCSTILKYKDSRTGNWRKMKRFLLEEHHPQCIDL